MATKFLSPEAQFRAGVNLREPMDDAPPAEGSSVAGSGVGRTPVAAPDAADRKSAPVAPEPRSRPMEFAAIQAQEDAPPCSTCGSLMIRSGSCYKCVNCGTTSGCA